MICSLDKREHDWVGLGRKGDALEMVQETKIWP